MRRPRRKSDLEPIGEHVDDLLQRLGMPAVTDLTRLVEQWRDIVPEPWASAARPVGLDDDVLSVEVSDGVHASLLKYQIEGLLSRLGEELGAGVVESVRFRLRRRQNGL